MIRYLKWLLWDSVRCKHIPGEWRHIEMGMRKARWCVKCGKCTDLI